MCMPEYVYAGVIPPQTPRLWKVLTPEGISDKTPSN